MRMQSDYVQAFFLSLYPCIKHIHLYFHMKWVPNSGMRLTVRCIQYVLCLELHSDCTHMHLKGNALKNDIQSALAKGMRLTRKPVVLWGHSFFKLKGLQWCNAGRREAKGERQKQRSGTNYFQDNWLAVSCYRYLSCAWCQVGSVIISKGIIHMYVPTDNSK